MPDRPLAVSLPLDELSLSRAGVDRRAEWRTDEAQIDRAWNDPLTRVLDLATTTQFPVTEDRSALILSSPSGDGAGTLFLGVDGEEVAYFARLPVGGEPVHPTSHVASLREAGALLSDRDCGLAVNATALAAWHANHRHCPRCGAATSTAAAGHTRRCPADDSQHYPRTDPAVIMAVLDDDDCLLLGRQASWPERRFSTLAGFVEPGESLEAAVRREVAEEVGVTVTSVTYAGSQPWPFPASLMLGFFASAPGSRPPVAADGTEIAEAGWFDRDELMHAMQEGTLGLPPRVSIARRLVEAWWCSDGRPADLNNVA